ncbi:hypothetical protein HDU98_009937 [Podochytrium sp. JEL0797]|nr:hypothetical protein HDU98_009937 [Podochytrium sp. JEL0797]
MDRPATIIVALAAAVTGVAVLLSNLLAPKPKTKGLQTLATLTTTPLVVIPSLSLATGCTILGKMEMLGAGGSSKDRLARAVISDAEAKGLIEPHQDHVIVEGTVGSTGISLATICNAKGYKCLIILPDDVAAEKSDILLKLGAMIEKVRPCSIADSKHFVRIAEARAKEINEAGKLNANGKPIKAYFVNQFETLVNFDAHFTQTGPEIYEQLMGIDGVQKLDSFVMGAGTGGTLAGVSLFLKSKIPDLRVVLADPYGSGLFFKVKNNIMYSPTEAEGTRKRHQTDTIVEGVGINRLTRNFQIALNVPGLISDAVKVTDAEAIEMSRYILRNDGLFCGSSTAVHLVAAVREARRLGPGHTLLTVLCDSGTRHLTKFWNDDRVQLSQSAAVSDLSLDLISNTWPEGIESPHNDEVSENVSLSEDFNIDIIKRLPPELSWEIFELLNPKDVANCGLVSRTWRAFARNESLWFHICQRAWKNKLFHPLELHPLVNWGRYNNLSLQEMVQILARRGVILRRPTTSQPATASWPSSIYPVSLSSWSWANWRPHMHRPAIAAAAVDWESEQEEGDESDASVDLVPFPSENDMPWLNRLLSVTFPIQAPPSVPTTCGKWMASFVAAERDRRRTRITTSELTGITW